MLLSILSGGDIRDIIVSLLLSLPIIFFALAFHETAHGYVAWKCGDPTAHNLGRLTLNPVKHLDPIGFLSMLIFGFGWAKPIPVNARYFRNPKRGMALSALAGPAANALLGVISAVLAGLFFVLYTFVGMPAFLNTSPIGLFSFSFSVRSITSSLWCSTSSPARPLTARGSRCSFCPPKPIFPLCATSARS